ncbi:MAG: DinB family protein [Actinomycetota bacterium]|nr:DinB family protein [Actinomycetota bacterium]
MKPEYSASNDSERTRLESLLERLSEQDLARRLPNGITIAAVLVHLAFWDEYACSALRAWKTSGFSGSHTNFEAVNDGVLALVELIPDHAVIEMTREAAAAVDHEAETVDPELAGVIEGNGKLRTLERAQHRRTHVDQIERALLQD